MTYYHTSKTIQRLDNEETYWWPLRLYFLQHGWNGQISLRMVLIKTDI
jgi:hypothetical protein